MSTVEARDSHDAHVQKRASNNTNNNSMSAKQNLIKEYISTSTQAATFI